MSSPEGPLPHIWVDGRARNETFQRPGGGNPKVRPVERRAHGDARMDEARQALAAADAIREQQELTLDELQALGVILVLEGAETAYRLKLDSLDRMSKHRKTPRLPKWLLLSVMPAYDEHPERAQVWVGDEYRDGFLRLFEDFLSKNTKKGNPRNRELVANIGRIRRAALSDLWQSADSPPTDGLHWWELWLRRTDDALEIAQQYADVIHAPLAVRSLELDDRVIVWIQTRWETLLGLPFTKVPVAEIRRPEFADTVEDLSVEDQDDLAVDLVGRVKASQDPGSPAVCHLDSGVRRTHALLAASLDPGDLHSVVRAPGGSDPQDHGTQMAGLALLGPLDDLLTSNRTVVLRHRLESVKIIPDPGQTPTDPHAYGLVTAQAVAQPEIAARRRRVFCMPITATPDRGLGEPTLWSASVDALAAGVDISMDGKRLRLLGAPDDTASRLFIVSAGNVDQNDLHSAGYPDACDLSLVEDPGQAWNALTVGAHTDLTQTPTDPSFAGWSPVAPAGDISPHSRTGVTFGAKWPNKPDICMEGGNVLHDGAGTHDGRHPLLALRTTSAGSDLALSSTNATSAATAQAARLAAMAQARYPLYWPETIRALLVHGARWTSAMRARVDQTKHSKTRRRALVRRYGWGVPTEETVLSSSASAVTLVTQDAFMPFEGEDHKARRLRLHRLPWPAAALRQIPAAEVALRVTLSYFIEPAASRRGWRQRYTYASHGLRFELKAPQETTDALLRRVNWEAENEEDGTPGSSQESGRWTVGKNQRNGGSLHHDLWIGTAEELAACDAIAIYPVGGWWKNNDRKDRADRTVRYALVVSLVTRELDVDLYAPVAAQIAATASTEVPAT